MKEITDVILERQFEGPQSQRLLLTESQGGGGVPAWCGSELEDVREVVSSLATL